MKHVLVAFFLLGTAFAELPDAPQPQHPHSPPLSRASTQRFVVTGQRVERWSFPIPHTPLSLQPDYDNVNADPFHRSPTFRPMWHVRGTRSVWITIRFK